MIIVRRILTIILSMLLILSLVLFYLTFTDYRPEEIEILTVNNNQVKPIVIGEAFNLTTYNIGYAGLDRDQDFFFDGGKNSRAESKMKVMENLEGIVNIIDNINPDILLLQEVDIDSSRSYGVNQKQYFNDKYPNYSYIFGKNYDVPWVPIPIFRPMGKATSGIITYSKFHTKNSARYDLPGKEKWLIQLFELDRCFTETRYQVENDKALAVINIHLSAFDKGGLIRQQQLIYFKKHLEKLYKEDLYIVVGGDWNHNLPELDPYRFAHEEPWPFWLKDIPDDFEIEGYNWAVDYMIPTVRTLASKYIKGYNFLASVDGFLISDNIEIIRVNAINTGFEYTDHNPVSIELKLK